MTDADLLRSLGVDPSQLDPAPPWAPRQSAGVDTPGHGRRWLDRCMPCLIATTPRGGPRAPLTDTLAVLREAAREAGVHLTIVADES
ncbi:hypothetical protein [Streptomyces sp. NPDC005181]|uniref:hypothetical protein n=1 Tax=Streptomyces sp. NPDC005181 TaxID=3156869 RepID=UPI0033A35F7E